MRSVLIVLLLMFLASSAALAHEKREVAGKFVFVVGFVNEPAFAGQMNGVDLRVMTAKGHEPIEGADKTLEVMVSRKGDQADVKLPFRPRYKDPGRYGAYFLPTKSGAYIFVIKGTINGVVVNESFLSGEGFHDVEDPVRFP